MAQTLQQLTDSVNALVTSETQLSSDIQALIAARPPADDFTDLVNAINTAVDAANIAHAAAQAILNPTAPAETAPQ